MSAAATPDASRFAQAIALYQDGRLEQARDALRALLDDTPRLALAWNALGHVERDCGDSGAAAAAFDRALAIDQDDDIALRGRARIALERDEENALARYAALQRAHPDDLHLLLEATEAGLSAHVPNALAPLRTQVEAHPEWIEGPIELARLAWEHEGENGFDSHLSRSAQSGRLDGLQWRAWIELLADCGDYSRAADVTRQAQALLGGPDLALMEAVCAGKAGDLQRAEACLAALPAAFPGRTVHDAVHAIRVGELERARSLLDALLVQNPTDVSAWGLAELVYRALGDPRSDWLSGRDGFVETIRLPLSESELAGVARVLRDSIARGRLVAGQSVRGGRQTRWRPLDRPDPELAPLRCALTGAIENYQARLPAADAAHPLLRHRDLRWRVTGNWAVRLTGGGRHVSHIHSLGIVSSACYIVVPPAGTSGGVLELGRPPSDLRLNLPPIRTVKPVPGELTLFPSYLHHGTTSFENGERITFAFDVLPA